MTRKISKADDWIPAKDAAKILSEKCGFPVDPEYIARLSRSKKQPVRTRPVSGHLLYNREDVMRCKVRKRANKQ